MKYNIVLILFAATASVALRAETPTEREFKLLRDQRDKAVAAAIEPINRRYQASLDQLLRRATQANDLETALKIKQEMAGSAITAAAAAPSNPGAAPHQPKTKKQWEDFLNNTVWTMTQSKTNSPWGPMTFRDKGVVEFNRERIWTITKAGKVVVDTYFLEFGKDMKTFKVVWGDTGELTGTLNTEAK